LRLGWAMRFLGEELAEGTSSSAVRLVLWTVIALAVIALVGPSIYSVAQHAHDCAMAAAGGGTSC
jgi:hypothetical protein